MGLRFFLLGEVFVLGGSGRVFRVIVESGLVGIVMGVIVCVVLSREL